MKHIAIIGECMIELNGKPFGPMQQTFGGDTLNAAVYLCRGRTANQDSANIQVSYVTALGSDPLSQGMISRWQQEGLDTELVLRDEHRSPGLYLIQLDDQGERTFLYWRHQSAARYLMQHPDIDGIKAALSHVDMVFLSGITLAILPEQDRMDLLNLLAKLRQQGVEIAFDSNFRPALWPDDDHVTVKTIYEAMYRLTDLALVTFDDEQQLWGDNTPTHTLNRLKTLGVKHCVVKTGADGCLVEAHGLPAQTVATTPVEQVVDTTSAGDSFNGGFLSAYLAGYDLVEACQRGNKLAGTVIQHRGAIIDNIYTQAALIS
ncbi:sugar kinase [Vibrio ruber]|uniref:sugar kinase n=1 Tax=Vibrio ruber TaxID=184755 RepID=UPI0028932DD4|nr:sugar kinase [Vibrio ruber]WNJ94206.1 sugar kinase [Vibrio ruber]